MEEVYMSTDLTTRVYEAYAKGLIQVDAPYNFDKAVKEWWQLYLNTNTELSQGFTMELHLTLKEESILRVLVNNTSLSIKEKTPLTGAVCLVALERQLGLEEEED